MLDGHRRQALEHAVVDHRPIGQGHLARQMGAQGAGAELLILVLDEVDGGGGGELSSRMVWPGQWATWIL